MIDTKHRDHIRENTNYNKVDSLSSPHVRGDELIGHRHRVPRCTSQPGNLVSQGSVRSLHPGEELM